MKKQLIFLAITLFLLSSCVSTKTYTSKTLDIYGAGIVQNPVLVDLEVRETKVVGIAVGGSSSSLESIKQEAVANAIEYEPVNVEPNKKKWGVTSRCQCSSTS